MHRVEVSSKTLSHTHTSIQPTEQSVSTFFPSASLSLLIIASACIQFPSNSRNFEIVSRDPLL